MLFRHDLAKVIHAFIASHLNYCNPLCLGLPQCLLLCLQMVQNAAPTLLTGTSRREHITPVLASLHRLPEFNFKILLLVCKVLKGLDPIY